MALAEGTITPGAGGGGTATPGTGIPGLGGLPPISAGFPGGGLPNFPAILPNIVIPGTPAGPPNIPDYPGILNQLMSPYESAAAAQRAAFDQQMAALQDQVAHQRGFAEDAYGINKESDQAAYDQYMKQLIATLVGRGLGSSGAKNYYSRIRAEALQRQLALLKNSLQSYLFGLQSQLTNAQLAGQGQLAASQAQLAGQRASLGMQLPRDYPATPGTPGTDPSTPSGFYV